MVKIDRHAKVMVVDDEPTVRKLVSHILESSGYEVRSAGSARDALALLHTDASFDLLLTDVAMPCEDGRELATEVRRRLPAVKLLFMSGHGGSEALDGECGGTPLLAKPFRIEQLLDRVARTLA